MKRSTTVIVILIIVIVALIAELVIPLIRSPSSKESPAPTGNIDRAKIAEGRASLEQLRIALEAYRAENGTYPTNFNWHDGTPLVPSYLESADWERITSSLADLEGTISQDDYTITAHANDEGRTEIRLTPAAIYP